MPATEDAVTPVVSGVPPGVGWVYLQPAPVTLVHYRHKQSIGLGAAQIVIGSLCIILNVVDMVVGDFYGYGVVGHGIWCGALFIVTGSFGVSAGQTKTKCKVVAYMVLCIISASFTSALVICGIMAAVRFGPYSAYCQHGINSSYYCSVAFPQNYASNNGFQVIHMTHYGQPMMPCQPVISSACQPSFSPSACQPSIAPPAYQPKPMLTHYTQTYAPVGADPNREFFADDDYKY